MASNDTNIGTGLSPIGDTNNKVSKKRTSPIISALSRHISRFGFAPLEHKSNCDCVDCRHNEQGSKYQQ